MIPMRLLSDEKGKICRTVKLRIFPNSVLSLMDALDRSMRAMPMEVDHSASAISSGLAACEYIIREGCGETPDSGSRQCNVR